MQTRKSSRVSYIVLRHMRRPILFLIAVYAISMTGWILIPGVDADGNEQTLSLFHAFYFLTYTATTTGFGELPHPFTEGQRMWGIVSLYAGVIAWFYALGSIVRLVQNPDLQQSLAERRFADRVARITEPFCIICGLDNTGAMLTRGLTDAGMVVVIIDQKRDRIRTAALRDYRTAVSMLCADPRIPEHLIEAGLRKSNCKAVIALTQDEEVNLSISVTARLLNPDVWVVTQSTSESHEEILSTLGENVHIIDPFQTYARYLDATIADPAVNTLNQWLAGTPQATLDDELRLPKGTWILCGFDSMGRRLRASLDSQGMPTVVIEPNPSPEDEDLPGLLVGAANQETLMQAGVKDAAAIVAGTSSDSDNLGVLLNARALNPDIFFMVRQNSYRNHVVFQAADADLVMMPSLVSARRIYFLLVAPLLKTFFETLRERDAAEEGQFARDVIERLKTVVGGTRPRLWTVDTCEAYSRAVVRIAGSGRSVTLAHLVSDPADRSRQLPCLPLVLQSDERTLVMPELSTPVRPGDQILFCGNTRAKHLLDATMNNDYTLAYLMTGTDEPRGWVMKWLNRRRAASAPQA